MKKKYRTQVISSHAYPGFKIETDHSLVKATCNIRFKRRIVTKKKKWNLEKLKEESSLQTFQSSLRATYDEKETYTWEEVKNNIHTTCEKVLGKNILEPRKPWMNQQILKLIKERNKLREVDYAKYKHIKNQITNECRIAKDEWIRENCKEIEYFLLKNNADKAYNRVKSLEYTQKTRSNIV